MTTDQLPIKVLCVDDSADITRLVCMAIAAEDDMDVVGELHSAENLLEEVRSKEPDILLLDLTMPGVDVLRSLPELHEHMPTTKTVVFSGYDDQERVDAALEAGAWGYISKSVDMDVLVDGVRQVANGKFVVLR